MLGFPGQQREAPSAPIPLVDMAVLDDSLPDAPVRPVDAPATRVAPAGGAPVPLDRLMRYLELAATLVGGVLLIIAGAMVDVALGFAIAGTFFLWLGYDQES